MPVPVPLIGDTTITVRLGIGDPASIFGLWDDPGNLWDDTARWADDAHGSDDLMLDISGYVLRIATVAGRVRYTDRFRTSSATIDLDNAGGEWTPAAGLPTIGLVALRPGVRLDVAADGDRLWSGYVEAITDAWRPGEPPTTRLTGLDLFGRLAVNNTPAQSTQGANETAEARAARILNHALDPATAPPLTILGTPPGASMQATTLAGAALSMLQLTADSEGGAVWCDPDGSPTLALFDYFTSRAADAAGSGPTWTLGAAPLAIATVVGSDWSQARLINEAQIARAGGSVQVAADYLSQHRYGRRTHRRLDLITADDTRPRLIADRLVARLGWDRAQLTGVTVVADTPAAVTLGRTVRFGDTAAVTVNADAWAWSLTTQVIAVSHTITPDTWTIRLGLDDTLTADPTKGS